VMSAKMMKSPLLEIFYRRPGSSPEGDPSSPTCSASASATSWGLIALMGSFHEVWSESSRVLDGCRVQSQDAAGADPNSATLRD
jgi:hypothetical protein